MNLKRRTSLPLVRSQSFQLAGKEGIVLRVSSVTLLVLYNTCVTAGSLDEELEVHDEGRWVTYVNCVSRCFVNKLPGTHRPVLNNDKH